MATTTMEKSNGHWTRVGAVLGTAAAAAALFFGTDVWISRKIDVEAAPARHGYVSQQTVTAQYEEVSKRLDRIEELVIKLLLDRGIPVEEVE